MVRVLLERLNTSNNRSCPFAVEADFPMLAGYDSSCRAGQAQDHNPVARQTSVVPSQAVPAGRQSSRCRRCPDDRGNSRVRSKQEPTDRETSVEANRGDLPRFRKHAEVVSNRALIALSLRHRSLPYFARGHALAVDQRSIANSVGRPACPAKMGFIAFAAGGRDWIRTTLEWRVDIQ